MGEVDVAALRHWHRNDLIALVLRQQDHLRDKNDIIRAYAGPGGMTPEDVWAALERIPALERELAAYKRAKAENDERFQIAAAEARQERDTALEQVARWQRAYSRLENAARLVVSDRDIDLIRGGPELRAALEATNG